jgi:hypothetical protein
MQALLHQQAMFYVYIKRVLCCHLAATHHNINDEKNFLTSLNIYLLSAISFNLIGLLMPRAVLGIKPKTIYKGYSGSNISTVTAATEALVISGNTEALVISGNKFCANKVLHLNSCIDTYFFMLLVLLTVSATFVSELPSYHHCFSLTGIHMHKSLKALPCNTTELIL